MSRSDIPFYDLFFSKTNDYLNLFLPRQAGKSPETVRAYRRGLSEFYDYVVNVRGLNPMSFRFEDCTYKFALEYSQALHEGSGLSPGTVNQRMAAIKSYLRYVSDCDISRIQIYLAVRKVPLLQNTRKIRPVIEENDLSGLLDTPEMTDYGKRDRVLLILLYDTAVRVGELVSITLGDVLLNVDQPSILIHGKGRRQRVISLSEQAASHLRNYIHYFHRKDASPDTPLFFTTLKGRINPMSERNVQRIVHKYADQFRQEHQSLPDKVYPHMFRRTKATNLYRDGVPLEMIAALLGHEHLDTTRIYAIPSQKQLSDAINKGPAASNDEAPIWKDPDKKDQLKSRFGL